MGFLYIGAIAIAIMGLGEVVFNQGDQ